MLWLSKTPQRIHFDAYEMYNLHRSRCILRLCLFHFQRCAKEDIWTNTKRDSQPNEKSDRRKIPKSDELFSSLAHLFSQSNSMFAQHRSVFRRHFLIFFSLIFVSHFVYLSFSCILHLSFASVMRYRSYNFSFSLSHTQSFSPHTQLRILYFSLREYIKCVFRCRIFTSILHRK